MNKKIRKCFILSCFLALLNGANASLLWNIDYAINQYRNNSFECAKEYLIEYIKNNPNDEDGYYWLAKTYYSLKDAINASEYFKKAHELTIKEKNIEKIDFKTETISSTEDYLDIASMYFEKGDLIQADTYAELMLKINPKSASAYFIKAKISQLNGDEVKAKEYLNKAIVYNNKLIKTRLAKSLNINQLPEMSLEMYEMLAYEGYFSSDINSAILYCKKYLNINPSNIDITNMLIDLYIKNDELVSAQILINSVLENLPNIQTFLLQAKIYKLQNNAKEEDILLEAYKINPNNSKVLLALGEFYINRGNYVKSKKYFEILLSVNDELQEAYFGYIYSLIELGEIENAMSLIRKFSSLNNLTSQTDFLLAKICEKTNDYNEAISYLNSAILKYKNPHYYFLKAKINYKQKNYKTAINCLKEITKLPDFESMQEKVESYLIKNYIKTGDSYSAQILLNKSKGLDKNRIIYKYNLYIIYKLQGKEKIAKDQLDEIEKTKLVNLLDYIDLAEVYFEENKINESIKVLDKGIKKYPKEFELYSKKAEIYTYLNKFEQVKLILKKAIQENND